MIAAEPKSEYDRKTHAQGAGSSQSSLSGYVKTIFEDFKTSRKPFEEEWITDWRNFLSQYSVNTRWKSETEGAAGRSKVFIGLTALKCHTAHAKIMDAMFPGKSDVPFDMSAINIKELGLDAGEVADAIHSSKEKLRTHFKKIEFEETVNEATLEMCILGTGVLKGPVIETRRSVRAVEQKALGMNVAQIDPSLNRFKLEQFTEQVATIDHVPLWNYYCDANAKSNKDSIGEIHFQRLLPGKFLALASGGGYNKEAVKAVYDQATIHDPDDTRWMQLADNFMGEQGDKDKRISIIEYQGQVPVEHLRDYGTQLPDGVEDYEILEAIVVLAGSGDVIKAVVNPLGRRQFSVCPYKKRPGVVFGEGVAGAMRDSQMMINSAARMLIDNKALSGNGMVAVSIDKIDMKKTRNLKVYPGKTWYLKRGARPEDAIGTVAFADVTAGLQDLIVLFERFADESTGIPKYTSGNQGSFLNKTATGISMLMGAANLNIKTVMKNIDNHWIEPKVEAFHEFFLVTGDGGGLQIPLKVRATGTDSLITKEIRIESIMKFMQVSNSPQDAIFQDRPKMMREIARLLEVDDLTRPKEVVDQILKHMAEIAQTPIDIREKVAYEKLFPYLTPEDQHRLLVMLGLRDKDQPPPPEVPRNDKGIPGLPEQPERQEQGAL